MNIKLQKEIDMLKRHILALGAKVENDLRMAVRAADNQDEALAREVVGREDLTIELKPHERVTREVAFAIIPAASGRQRIHRGA